MQIPSCICRIAQLLLFVMISQRTIGLFPAQPGWVATLSIGLVPELLPIITVAVPGPA